MKILVTGDLFVSDDVRGLGLFDPAVLRLFAAADLRIINLEAPIGAGRKTDRNLKTGPHLTATPETALPPLKDLGADLVTLANNHIRDFGGRGLAETLEHLQAAGIGAVGAGMDLAAAAKPFVLERDGLRISVLNFGENEWASAGPGRPGANPYDVVANAMAIRAARGRSDFVLVIIHGGQEDYHFPTPRMVRQYRFFAESGASVIVGHHPHCIGGVEVHRGTPIFYSLGNFLFTLPSNDEWWYKGLVLSLRLEKGAAVAWELVPVAMSKTDPRLARLDGEAGRAVLAEVEGYSRTIADEAGLAREWESFLDRYKGYYLTIFSPLNIVRSRRFKTLLAKLRLDRLFITRRQYAEVLNTIRCESHAEAAKDVIERTLE